LVIVSGSELAGGGLSVPWSFFMRCEFVVVMMDGVLRWTWKWHWLRRVVVCSAALRTLPTSSPIFELQFRM
jgi:hypothetical protein